MSRTGKTPARKPRLGKGLYWRGPVIWARFKVAGREYRVSCHTGTESVAAKRREQERGAVIAQARYGDSGPKSWPEAVLQWTETPPDNLSAKTLKRYASSLLQVEPFLNHLSVQEITPAVLKDVVAKRRRTATKRTVQRDLTAISSVLDVAEDLEWIEENVAHSFNRKKIRSARHVITLPMPEHIEEVIAACPPKLADLAELALETGARQNELVSQHRMDVFHDRRQMTIYFGAKRSKVRTIDLNKRALAAAKRQPASLKCPNLLWSGCGEPLKNASSRFAAIVRRVAQKAAQDGREFRPFRFHDLRHFFAVRELKAGRLSIYALQQHLGHDSVKTTEGYLVYLTAEEAGRARQAGGTKSGTVATVRSSTAQKSAAEAES